MTYEELQEFIQEHLKKRSVDISRLYPAIYNNVWETSALKSAGNRLLQDYQDKLNQWLHNQYIYGADDKGLTIFERELDLRVDRTATLRARRERIIAKLNAPLTAFTKRWLKAELDRVLGTGNYEYQIRYATYELWLKVKRYTEYIRDFTIRLRYQIPANIGLRVEIDREKENQKLYAGVAKVIVGHKYLKAIVAGG